MGRKSLWSTRGWKYRAEEYQYLPTYGEHHTRRGQYDLEWKVASLVGSSFGRLFECDFHCVQPHYDRDDRGFALDSRRIRISSGPGG